MPLFEFECEKGHLTEQLFKNADNSDEIICPTCNKKAVKIISKLGNAFFVGEGFYNPSISQTKWAKDRDKFSKEKH